MENSVRAQSFLITGADVYQKGFLDVRSSHGKITEIGLGLRRRSDEQKIEASGGALLPGLHDHHIHLMSLAASRQSVQCGPPHVSTREELQTVLREAQGGGWIRGIGYHESVAGDLTRGTLDALCSERPVRIQHRSGRLWTLNSAALEAIGTPQHETGQFFRKDEQLRQRFPQLDDLDGALVSVSRELAEYGVTGVTDATPSNSTETATYLRSLPLRQSIVLMGSMSLPDGALKIILDDYELPDIDALAQSVSAAHSADRPVAFHCVSRTELVFALAVLDSVGVHPQDRIEHASECDDDALQFVKKLGVCVVTQPHFVFERGDVYRQDRSASDLANLYRCKSFQSCGIPLGGGTDAPFGSPDPWQSMRAAVTRETRSGYQYPVSERLSPEEAIGLFLTDPQNPGGEVRSIEVGSDANCCLLSVPWRVARESLTADHVRATIFRGSISFSTNS